MKLKINTDGKEFFIIKDKGLKVTENVNNEINFSNDEVNKIMSSLEQWGTIVLRNIDVKCTCCNIGSYVSFDFEKIIRIK